MGFRPLNGCEAGVDVLYVIENAMPYVITIIDCEVIPEISARAFNSVNDRVRKAFLDAGYTYVRSLSIYCTTQVERIKYATTGDTSHWIVDKNTRELIIYENQPEEFMDIRPGLERYHYGSVQPKSERLRKRSLFTVNNLIIIINVIVFFITLVGGDVYDAEYIAECGGLYPEYVSEGNEYYRLFTSMFLHFGFSHIVGNMIMLAIVGNMLERFTNKWKYLLIYIGGGLVSNLCSYWYYLLAEPNTVSAGASGAVFAAMGGLVAVALFDKSKKYYIKPVNIILLVVCTLRNTLGSAGVNHIAHITGLIAGFLISLILLNVRIVERHR